MTYRERREARAERLEEWAEKRQAKAEAGEESAKAKAGIIPFGQPVMPDHHSYGRDMRYREGIRRGFDKAYEHADKAKSMAGRAATIQDQLEHSIYDDDLDAIERLQERIADLEAQRDRIKAYNASCRERKDIGDLSLLDKRQREKLESAARHGMAGTYGQFPSFGLTNLTANIRRNKQRLERLS